MGKVKNSKLKRSLLSQKNASKRWMCKQTFSLEDSSLETQTLENSQEINKEPMPIDYNTVRPGPSTEGFDSSMHSQFSEDNKNETPSKKERPRGFELVSMYGKSINFTDDSAPVYCLID